MCVLLEHHPNDSRIKIDESGTCQTLTNRMGTGGGNVPLVISVDFSHADDVVRVGGRYQRSQTEPIKVETVCYVRNKVGGGGCIGR